MTNFLKFRRGQELLEYSKDKASFEGNAFLPERVFIPLSVGDTKPLMPIVSTGEYIREGQVIARSTFPEAVTVHSSIPGILYNLVKFDLPNGKILHSVAIRLEGSFDILGKPVANYSWRASSVSELLSVLASLGVVNTSNTTGQSLAFELRTAIKNNTSTICVNLFDGDPSCGLNSILFNNEFEGIVEGLGLIAKILEAKKIICVHKLDKSKFGKLKKIEEVCSNLEIEFIKTADSYPAGIKFSKREYSQMFVIDIPTLIYAYEAVKTNMPMTSVFVLVGGAAITESKVLKVRIGTPIGSLIEECGGFTTKPEHIIINGLIRGSSIDNLDIPITKIIKSIHILGKERIKRHTVSDCINCGLCFNSCPYFLNPKNIFRHLYRNDITDDILKSIEICKGCSCCSACCPARIPLADIIADAKIKNKQGVLK